MCVFQLSEEAMSLQVLQLYIVQCLGAIQYQREVWCPLTQPYVGIFCRIEFHAIAARPIAL